MHLIFQKLGLRFCFILLLGGVIFSSCSVNKRTFVRNYPISRPFLYDNKITLTGNISKDEKIRLTTELNNYWDDSLKVRKIQQFGVIYKIRNPAVF